MTTDARNAARLFLEGVRTQLGARLHQSEATAGRSIAEQIEATCESAKTAEPPQKHLKSPEAAFLNLWVARALNDQLRASGFDSEQAKAALLAESHSALSDIVGGPAARPAAYPFSKGLDTQAHEIYERWARPKGSQSPFPTTWPDLAIRSPFKIVFEGKYFREGSLDVAERQLVAAIHESLFYLGVPATRAQGREWGYDYACLIAYDASRDQTLVQAWNGLAKVHDRFWNDANLHVIMVGATQREGMNFSAYQRLFRDLGFTAYESHKVLKHPKLKRSVYFNRDRTGRVWFAVYEKDNAVYKAALWDDVAPPQKKDARPGIRTLEPKREMERQAFLDLIG